MPTGLQGHSLISSINNQNVNIDQFILSEYNGATILQNKKWLYFLPSESSGIEQSILYQKTTDPFEKNNVSAKYPELTRTLYEQSSLLRSYDAMLSKTKKLPDYNEIKLDPEKVKRLQKEGYF